MATFDYTRARKTADRLLAKFGIDKSKEASAFLVVTAPMQDDAVEPWNPQSQSPAQAETQYPVTVVLLDYSDGVRDGTLILENDRRAFISAHGLSVAPQAGNLLKTADGTFTIVRVKPLKPADVVVFFEAQVR